MRQPSRSHSWKMTGGRPVPFTAHHPRTRRSLFHSFLPLVLQSQIFKRASNDTAFFVREEDQMPVTWLLSRRDSWGFINYLGNLLSAASEYCSDLSCTRWPVSDHWEASGSWCVNMSRDSEHVNRCSTHGVQVEEKHVFAAFLLKVLFIISLHFFKAVRVVEYY